MVTTPVALQNAGLDMKGAVVASRKGALVAQGVGEPGVGHVEDQLAGRVLLKEGEVMMAIVTEGEGAFGIRRVFRLITTAPYRACLAEQLTTASTLPLCRSKNMALLAVFR